MKKEIEKKNEIFERKIFLIKKKKKNDVWEETVEFLIKLKKQFNSVSIIFFLTMFW